MGNQLRKLGLIWLVLLLVLMLLQTSGVLAAQYLPPTEHRVDKNNFSYSILAPITTLKTGTRDTFWENAEALSVLVRPTGQNTPTALVEAISYTVKASQNVKNVTKKWRQEKSLLQPNVAQFLNKKADSWGVWAEQGQDGLNTKHFMLSQNHRIVQLNVITTQEEVGLSVSIFNSGISNLIALTATELEIDIEQIHFYQQSAPKSRPASDISTTPSSSSGFRQRAYQFYQYCEKRPDGTCRIHYLAEWNHPYGESFNYEGPGGFYATCASTHSCINNWVPWQQSDLPDYPRHTYLGVPTSFYLNPVVQGAQDASNYSAEFDAINGQIFAVEPLSLSSTYVKAGNQVTARFKVKNISLDPILLTRLSAGARRGNGWDGEQVDFPHVENVSLLPGQEFFYEKSRSFSAAGNYFAEPVVQIYTSWTGVPGANRVYFTVDGNITNPTPVPTPSPGTNNIDITSLFPQGERFYPEQSFNPVIEVRTNGFSLNCARDFLKNIDSNLYSTQENQGCTQTGGNTYRFYFNTPMKAPAQPGTYHSRWKVHYNGSVTGPEIDIFFTVGQPNNGPGTPRPLSPADGATVYGNQLPQLCATPVTDPEGDAVSYRFKIYEGTVRMSNWLSEPCWQPILDPGSVHHTYKWHVQAQDSHGNATAYGEPAQFTLAPALNPNPRPISSPPALPNLPVIEGALWNLNWPRYRILPITTDRPLRAGTLIKMDGLELSKLVADENARADYKDLRVIRRIDATHWQEVARVVYTNWDLEFFTASDLPVGTSTNYYLVYGNPNAGDPPTFQLSQGILVDLYIDKWWESWDETITLNSNVDFADVCLPPINHRERTGGSAFDDSEQVRGRLFIPTTGSWTFKVYMPDGYWLLLDHQQIGRFDGYDMNNKWMTVGSKDLKAGWYTLDLRDMWVNCGAFKFAMSGPGFPEQIVPPHFFQKFWPDTQHVTPDVEKFFDQTPPTTTAVPIPAQPNGQNGWYTTPVELRLEATDNPGGSGVQETWYYISPDGTVGGPNTRHLRYQGPLTFANNGIYTITFFSIDKAGNREAGKVTTIKVDRTAPQAAIQVDGTLGQNGWYTSTVQISLTGSDPQPGSGIARLEWSTDTGATWYPYTQPFTYDREGLSQVVARAIDVAGNIQSAPTSIDLKVDTRAPEVTVVFDHPQYTRAMEVMIHTSSADPTPGSGLITVASTFDGESVTDGQGIPLLWKPLGTYTLTTTARDAAGWITTRSASFELIATIAGLRDTIPLLRQQNEITQDGIAQAFGSKVDAALAAQARGNVTAAVNQLEALHHHIEAQRAKKISERAADVLIADIAYIIAQFSQSTR